jgi:hypothetical protein
LQVSFVGSKEPEVEADFARVFLVAYLPEECLECILVGIGYPDNP